MRGRALIGGTFAALLLVLAGSNLHGFVRVQRDVTCDYSPCPRPRSIESNALENRHPVVSGRYALYHNLSQRIEGASVTIPASMAFAADELARVGRVDVTVAETPLRVGPDGARTLRDEARGHFRWLHVHKPKKRWRTLHLMIEPGSREYVIAETGDELGDLFLLPAARYAELAPP